MAVFYSDTFDEAGATAITSHTPNTGGAYSHATGIQAGTTGTVGAGTGKLNFPTGTISIASNAATPGDATYTLSGTVRFGSNDGRTDMMIRRSGSNGYLAYAAIFTGIRIYRIDSGSYTQLVENLGVSVAANTDYDFTFGHDGTTVQFTFNGTQITANDSTYTAAGTVCVGGREVDYLTASADDGIVAGGNPHSRSMLLGIG